MLPAMELNAAIPNDRLNLAVSVARAALMEVGVSPDQVFPGSNGVRGSGRNAYRAALLGHMAVLGGGGMVRCWTCAHRTHSAPCTQVRDALRGFTCGAAS